MDRDSDSVRQPLPATSLRQGPREPLVVAMERERGGARSAFDHGTDEEILAGRLRAANPLASPSPNGGNGTTLRREVLYTLRTQGAASPEQIAEEIGASRTGVLQQLRTLEAAGLVARTVIRHGVGRPRHVYDLTPAAQELFPANYGALAQALLAAVNLIGGEDLVEQVFEARRIQLKTRLTQRLAERLPPSASLWERVREVARFQDENGYLGQAGHGDDGAIVLTEHNCAIYDVSSKFRAACSAEERLFGEVLGATVTRQCHIAAGGRSCTYRVEPAKA